MYVYYHINSYNIIYWIPVSARSGVTEISTSHHGKWLRGCPQPHLPEALVAAKLFKDVASATVALSSVHKNLIPNRDP